MGEFICREAWGWCEVCARKTFELLIFEKVDNYLFFEKK